MSEQKINPVTAVNPTVVQATFDKWRGKPADAVEARRAEVERDLEKAFAQAGPNLDLEKIDSLGGGTLHDKCGKLIDLHSELSGLEDALKERNELDQVARDIRASNRGGGDPGSPQVQPVPLARPASLADLVRRDFRDQGLGLGSPEFAAAADRRSLINTLSVHDDAILNTLFTTDAGWPPASVRDRGYVPSRRHPIQVIDILPRSSTTQELIKYMEETTYTNSAAAVAEGAAAPESTLALTEKEVAVRKLATHIPVTREELEDEPQVESYLNETVPFMVRQAADKMVLDGNGTAPNVKGILNVTGLQEQKWTHKSSSKVLDKPLNTLRKAKTKIRVGGRAMATHFILNPNLWDDIVLSESSAGGYYYGSPQTDFVERVWGLPVVLSDHLSDATDEDKVGGLVGDFSPMWIQMRMRRELETEWGYINDDFVKEIRRIKASIRFALVVKRPQAFAKITRPS